MQPVNVLPTFVSQDADLKTKESSDSSEGRNKDAEFARLVDKHVDGENTATMRKDPKPAIEPATANDGKAIAANGKNDADKHITRQESGSQKDAVVNKDSKDDDKTVERLAKETEINKVNEASQGDLTDSKALDESEQFISMLYNSDQTLTNTDGKAKQSGQANQVGNTYNSQENSANNNKIDILGGIASNKESAANTDESNLANEGKDSSPLTDHKLKAFSKDELLARAQLKSGSSFAQQSSVQVLKDYQQLLQSTQGMLNKPSITSDQLTTAQLESSQLKGNKISDIAITVSQENKGLLKEKVDTGLYQLPVEPIGKEKHSVDELGLLDKSSVVKATDTDSEKAALLATKTRIDAKSQLAAETSEESINSKAKNKIANSVSEFTNKEVYSEVKSDKDNLPLSKNNVDKLSIDRTLQAALNVGNTAKEQPVDAQSKQPVMTSAQVQALQQAQAHQKEQVVNSDAQSVEDAGAEYADSMNTSQGKAQEQGANVSNKITDNIATRSVSEIQSQAMQANQIKQNNDAYVEHQVSEVLNHTVASDTAQIQKNNVLLQQETISIFKKDFADAVKDKVMVMINQKLQQFDITLDPPEFGNMQVRVNLQGEQAAVNFIVQNQQAKDALEQNMHKLKEMLAEQGVDVGGANVEQQDQQQNNDENNLGQGNNNSPLLAGQEEIHNVEHVLSTKLFDSSATGVDYYA